MCSTFYEFLTFVEETFDYIQTKMVMGFFLRGNTKGSHNPHGKKSNQLLGTTTIRHFKYIFLVTKIKRLLKNRKHSYRIWQDSFDRKHQLSASYLESLKFQAGRLKFRSRGSSLRMLSPESIAQLVRRPVFMGSDVLSGFYHLLLQFSKQQALKWMYTSAYFKTLVNSFSPFDMCSVVNNNVFVPRENINCRESLSAIFSSYNGRRESLAISKGGKNISLFWLYFYARLQMHQINLILVNL